MPQENPGGMEWKPNVIAPLWTATGRDVKGLGDSLTVFYQPCGRFFISFPRLANKFLPRYNAFFWPRYFCPDKTALSLALSGPDICLARTNRVNCLGQTNNMHRHLSGQSCLTQINALYRGKIGFGQLIGLTEEPAQTLIPSFTNLGAGDCGCVQMADRLNSLRQVSWHQ